MSFLYRIRNKTPSVPKVEFHNLLLKLNEIRTKNHTVVICLDNSGANWLGIKNATLNLFPDITLSLPAVYSNLQFSNEQVAKFISTLKEVSFDQIIYSGFPASFNPIAIALAGNSKQKTIFHGSLSELIESRHDSQFVNIIEMAKAEVLDSIGFVKAGMSNWLTELYGIKSFFLQLKTPPNIFTKSNQKKDSKVRIGVFGSRNFNKNLSNQIGAALLIKNVEIHSFGSFQSFSKYFPTKIKQVEGMSHKDLLTLMASMDINLHLSFSEGMGGQTFTESLALGVPCLTSHNNQFLKDDEYLGDLLTVRQYDNPEYIANQINHVLQQDQNKLSVQLINYSKKQDIKAEELLDQFLA